MFLHFLEQQVHKLAFLEIAHLAAKADGNVNWKERGKLRSYIEEMGLLDVDIDLSNPRSLAEIASAVQDKSVQKIFLIEILMLLYTDGDYNDEEKEIVTDLKDLFGFSDETYESMREWVIAMDKLKIDGIKLILNA
ncbi:TerB family tellurite resistance protein [Paenibacillus sp. J5C_2022]|uniref:TerB family tellurite resistance protein n=1 Tax=Paenibacillus sp. J5C2022 TaxID=2977129 RepID=UPI0021CFF393|nr:TerB family tellurite resistance protein [Paenibacillus sp. J5C2022]MCU6707247.1 TerB family tellurite resistance protein [Paenibacillus sp. J5C2022]